MGRLRQSKPAAKPMLPAGQPIHHKPVYTAPPTPGYLVEFEAVVRAEAPRNEWPESSIDAIVGLAEEYIADASDLVDMMDNRTPDHVGSELARYLETRGCIDRERTLAAMVRDLTVEAREQLLAALVRGMPCLAREKACGR